MKNKNWMGFVLVVTILACLNLLLFLCLVQHRNPNRRETFDVKPFDCDGDYTDFASDEKALRDHQRSAPLWYDLIGTNLTGYCIFIRVEITPRVKSGENQFTNCQIFKDYKGTIQVGTNFYTFTQLSRPK